MLNIGSSKSESYLYSEPLLLVSENYDDDEQLVSENYTDDEKLAIKDYDKVEQNDSENSKKIDPEGSISKIRNVVNKNITQQSESDSKESLNSPRKRKFSSSKPEDSSAENKIASPSSSSETTKLVLLIPKVEGKMQIPHSFWTTRSVLSPIGLDSKNSSNSLFTFSPRDILSPTSPEFGIKEYQGSSKITEIDEKELHNLLSPKKLTAVDKFTLIDGKQVPIRCLGEGTYHIAFEILHAKYDKVILKCVKSALPATSLGKKTFPRQRVLSQGLNSYNDLKANGINVPGISNDVKKDGYFLIEKCSKIETPWAGNISPSSAMKSKETKQRLDQVKALLERMNKEKKLIVPDFKPSNASFNNNNELVVIDFCEDWEIPECQGPVINRIKDAANAWACGNKSIERYLLQDIK